MRSRTRLVDERIEAEAALGEPTAVERHGRAHGPAGGHGERHRSTHAEADHADMRAVDARVSEVLERGVDVVEQAGGRELAHVLLDRREVVVVELRVAGPVVQVWSDGQPAGGREPASDVIHVVVDAEGFLHDDHTTDRLRGRGVDRQRSLPCHRRNLRAQGQSPDRYTDSGIAISCSWAVSIEPLSHIPTGSCLDHS